MTDGIIQDIFKKHLSPYPYPFGAILTINVMKIRQEIIEKIKEETDRLYHIGYIEERKLIGDNQE